MICISCNLDKELSSFYFRNDTGKYKNTCKGCCISGKNKIRSDTHKKCKHCGQEKPFSEFQKAGGGKWLQPYCKSCDSERKKKHRKDNEQQYKESHRNGYLLKRDELSAKGKAERALKRPEVLKRLKDFWESKKMPEEERKRRKSEGDKRYKAANPDKIKEIRIRNRQRDNERAKKWQAEKMNDVGFRIKKNLRGRIYVALKRGIKSESTMKLLGCTIDFFKRYFQSLFTEGMSWEKYMDGEIVIDHIKPCASFDLKNPDEQRKCFHYTNLQPLWELDNLKKGAKLLEDADC